MQSVLSAPGGASRLRVASLAPLSCCILCVLLAQRAHAAAPADGEPQHRQPVDLDPVRVEGARPVNTTDDIATARKRLD